MSMPFHIQYIKREIKFLERAIEGIIGDCPAKEKLRGILESYRQELKEATA